MGHTARRRPYGDSGHLQGPLLAVIALTPLAAFEMVIGLPAAAQSLQRIRESAGGFFPSLMLFRP